MEGKKVLIIEKSIDFAVRIVNLYKYISEERREYVLSKQILRSGTSIGANIAEAHGAQSDADFIARLHISLKEAKETEYWLKVLTRTEYLSSRESDSIAKDLDEIIRLLISSIKSTKKRLTV